MSEMNAVKEDPIEYAKYEIKLHHGKSKEYCLGNWSKRFYWQPSSKKIACCQY